MKVQEYVQYEKGEFQSLVQGNVFNFAKNVYMVCEEGLDSINQPCNAVNLRTGELTYFNDKELVFYYPNAILSNSCLVVI